MSDSFLQQNGNGQQYHIGFVVIVGMKQKKILRLTAMLLLVALAFTACSSTATMHKHKRSNCDCPSF